MVFFGSGPPAASRDQFAIAWSAGNGGEVVGRPVEEQPRGPDLQLQRLVVVERHRSALAFHGEGVRPRVGPTQHRRVLHVDLHEAHPALPRAANPVDVRLLVHERVVARPAFEAGVPCRSVSALGEHRRAEAAAVVAVISFARREGLRHAVGCRRAAVQHPPPKAQVVEEVCVEVGDAPHFAGSDVGALPVVAPERYLRGEGCRREKNATEGQHACSLTRSSVELSSTERCALHSVSPAKRRSAH